MNLLFIIKPCTAAPNDPLNHLIYILLCFLTSFSETTILTAFPSLSHMAPKFVYFLFVSLISIICPLQAISTNQSQIFNLMRNSLSGNALFDWEVTGGKSYCNFKGVGCNSQGHVEKLDMTGWSISGRFPAGICSYLPELRILRLSHNHLHGDFLHSIINCSFLEELNMSSLYLAGALPDFSTLKSLRVLDMSYNLFTGDFPMSVTNLTDLQMLNFNENVELNMWQLPENVSKMTRLKSMMLMTCMLYGPIPKSIGNMTSLVDLELSGNYLTGQIPAEIGSLKNLQSLELYYNYHLSGSIPDEFGNLTELVDLDISVNKLTGNIPESICRLPKLEVLQLYNNSLTGEIPSAIANSTTLRILSIYDNSFTGEVPQNLGKLSAMVVLDLSENRLSGPLPAQVCNRGKLLYFLVLDNMFSGTLPDSYAKCNTLLRFRVNHNRLEGPIPRGLLGLPHVSIIDLSCNNFSGSIAATFGTARNLSELFLQSNKISGLLPPEISGAINLVKIDISNNLLSGPVPFQIGYLTKLNLLMLQGNMLNSSVPKSLSMLKSLNVLDLSNNMLSGNIPESLSVLLPNSINFSNNRLSGPIPLSLIKGGLLDSFWGNPGLCVPVFVSSDQNFPICSQTYNRKRLNCIWVIGVSVIIIIVGALLFLKRKLSKEKFIEQDETMSSSFFSYNMKSFHRISFDPQEILEGMVDKNKVGQGGSGTVYRIQLRSGEVIAAKRLWSKRTKDSASEDRLRMDKQLKTEVGTLGNVRHKNIVKLYSYVSSLDCNVLVYEYMPNGNLWDALHNSQIHLDWPTRHQIALGVAQGLAYLHHDLLPPIIHRDIKSTNILLDVNYQPKVADFGIAKVLQARGGKDSTTIVIAGTYGYLAPEYAYSYKATTKCDVYSFGVVLMELITGKKPLEADFGENKNIIYWISSKADTKEGAIEVLDKRLSGCFRDEMIRVLRIANCCTCNNPALRPTMNEVVQMLIEADPCRFDSCKSSNKTKETSTVTKINSTIEL
uniref:Protein kinase domain-containing protein n=1 Tax=Manihot esculenta TaxID=3983 RepID=A0A2C9U2D1_MANES